MSTGTDEPMEPNEPKNSDESVISDPSSDRESDPQYIRLRRSHIYLALIPVAALLGFAAGYFVWGQDAAQDVAAAPAAASGGQAEANPVIASRIEVDPAGDPSLGPADAPITIVEFSDFNCPHCQRWHREVSQELLSAYPDQIQFVYKDFPIVGGGRVGFLSA